MSDLREKIRDILVKETMDYGMLRAPVVRATDTIMTLIQSEVEAAEKRGAEAEREVCAKEAEGYEPQHEANVTIAGQVAKNIAKAIRARGEAK
ncbi:hypothetical protein GCM10008171_32380 [Methylopila jiangsuensis]|uniref:Uncharacterized protein n=1 Tax=Methylopila jiangsuensis TaxID=586230 RepID=A0A9W6JKV6_9HYPH|nr:hypothetical protein [Methylopila jiangsuensis]MDR6284627.1 hypothetical protein [Methylopila jiangsuensis]GLK77984.1 hypothetical protein GCM10008171_32380 [Methylopila jiangsuensis]